MLKIYLALSFLVALGYAINCSERFPYGQLGVVGQQWMRMDFSSENVIHGETLIRFTVPNLAMGALPLVYNSSISKIVGMTVHNMDPVNEKCNPVFLRSCYFECDQPYDYQRVVLMNVMLPITTFGGRKNNVTDENCKLVSQYETCRSFDSRIRLSIKYEALYDRTSVNKLHYFKRSDQTVETYRIFNLPKNNDRPSFPYANSLQSAGISFEVLLDETHHVVQENPDAGSNTEYDAERELPWDKYTFIHGRFYTKKISTKDFTRIMFNYVYGERTNTSKTNFIEAVLPVILNKIEESIDTYAVNRLNCVVMQKNYTVRDGEGVLYFDNERVLLSNVTDRNGSIAYAENLSEVEIYEAKLEIAHKLLRQYFGFVVRRNHLADTENWMEDFVDNLKYLIIRNSWKKYENISGPYEKNSLHDFLDAVSWFIQAPNYSIKLAFVVYQAKKGKFLRLNEFLDNYAQNAVYMFPNVKKLPENCKFSELYDIKQLWAKKAEKLICRVFTNDEEVKPFALDINYDRFWAIPINLRDKTRKDTSSLWLYDLKNVSQHYHTIESQLVQPPLVVRDLGNMFRMMYDEENWKEISTSIELFDVASLEDAFFFAQENQLSYEIAFRMLSLVPKVNTLSYYVAADKHCEFIYRMLRYNQDVQYIQKLATFFSDSVFSDLDRLGYTPVHGEPYENGEIRKICIKWACRGKKEACWSYVSNEIKKVKKGDYYGLLDPNQKDVIWCHYVSTLNKKHNDTDSFNRALDVLVKPNLNSSEALFYYRSIACLSMGEFGLQHKVHDRFNNVLNVILFNSTKPQLTLEERQSLSTYFFNTIDPHGAEKVMEQLSSFTKDSNKQRKLRGKKVRFVLRDVTAMVATADHRLRFSYILSKIFENGEDKTDPELLKIIGNMDRNIEWISAYQPTIVNITSSLKL